MATTKLNLPEIEEQQAGKYLTHNEALQMLDVFATQYLINIYNPTPPSSPNDGDAYFIPTGATGDWEFQVGKIAHWYNSQWNFYTVPDKWMMQNGSDGNWYQWNGSDWDYKINASLVAKSEGSGNGLDADTVDGIHATQIARSDVIRKSLLDSPLCRLFTPNKLVDTLAGSLTWTRATTATYIDRYGRVKYQGGTTATNLLTYSEQFDNAVWLKYNLSVTLNATIAPDGTLTADKIVESDSPDNTTHYLSELFTPAAGQVYTLSCYAKAEERSFCVIKFSATSAFPDNIDTFFNLLDGTFTNNYPSIVTPKIEKLNNGWFRCSVTATAQTSASTGAGIVISLDGSRTYNGDGVSGISIWGAQVEQSRVANGYLKTEAAAITTLTSSTRFIKCSREESDGWLIEGQSTNLFTYSEQFDNAAWTKVRSTVTSNTIATPDGASTADTLTDDTQTGSHGVLQLKSFTAGQTYTVSCFVKSGTQNEAALQFSTAQFGVNIAAFDLVNSTVITETNGTAKIDSLADGWCKVSFSVNCTTSGSAAASVLISQNSGVVNYTGDGTGTLYIWGAQLEQLPFASSYIPTTTTTVTRAADLVQMQINGNITSGLYSDWSVSYRFKWQSVGTSQSLLRHDSTAGSSRFYIIQTDGGSSILRDMDSSGVVVVGTNADTDYSAAWSIAGDTISGYRNGTLINSGSITRNADFVFSNPMWLFSFTSLPFYGHVTDFRIYDFALNADEVQFLSGVK